MEHHLLSLWYMKPNRWTIAVAGIFIQISLGAVYAWSVFRTSLVQQFGWTISEVTLTFTISIFALGIAAFFGGLWLNRRGPRVVAVTGGLLYGAGVFLASLCAGKLWLLYLTYGVIGGIGLGLAYVVPVAVLVRWFPDRRGLITGLAVGGFGAGALIAAPAATRLIQSVGVLHTFAYLGTTFLFISVAGGLFMQNPPQGWSPKGWRPNASQLAKRVGRDFTFGEALRTWQFWVLWLILFLNDSAGISVISQEAPMFQQLTGATAAAAATMVGLSSLGNAAGRVAWAWASDFVTRRGAFCLMYALQAVLFWILPNLHSGVPVTIVVMIVLTCYGGGAGTIPAFAADYFGPRNVGPIYGLLMTALGFSSAFGPLIIGYMRQMSGTYRGALHIIAGIMIASLLLPLIITPPTTAKA
jgi:OFA family oxalate/formate antiporter-like MFS transporter